MRKQIFASVWDAIETTAAEAENMKLRAALMQTIEQHIRSKGWSQTEAAHRLGVTQARISDLLRGRIHRFELESLVGMATTADAA